MTTITINKNLKLSKTKFEDLEELQLELNILQENYKLSEEHIEILLAREEDADYSKTKGSSWDKVKENIKRKDV